jgi:hypothetical protein
MVNKILHVWLTAYPMYIDVANHNITNDLVERTKDVNPSD